jgi:uncharacterized protein YgfB (UPF0149 family)
MFAMTDSLSWKDIQSKLIEIEAPLSVSEYHGHLIGRHVGGHEILGSAGMQMISELTAAPLTRLIEDADYWKQHMQLLIQDFEKDNYGFQPLMPDDDLPLAERLFGLANWCTGFLNGVGCALDKGAASVLLKEDDTLADFTEITNIDFEVSETNENEALYIELVEYVRLASLNMHENLKELLATEREESEYVH